MALGPRQAHTALYILSLICCCLSHHQISQCCRLSSIVYRLSLSSSSSSSRLSLGDNLSVDFASLHLCLLVSIYERLRAPFIAEQEVNQLSLKSISLSISSLSLSAYRVLSTICIYCQARARAAAGLVVSTFKSRPFGHRHAPRAFRQLSAFALLLSRRGSEQSKHIYQDIREAGAAYNCTPCCYLEG